MSAHDGVHFDAKLTKIQLGFVLQALCSVAENCSVFSKLEKCDLSIPRINGEKIITKREQLQESYNTSINNLKCFSRKDDSLYWSDIFVEI